MKRNKNTIIIFLFIVFELIFVNEVSYAGSLQGSTRGKKQITSRSSSLSSPGSSLGSTAGMTSGATPGLTSGSTTGSTSSSSSGSTKASTSGSTSSSSSGGLQDAIRKNSPITSPDEDEEDSESSSSGGLQDAIRKNSPIKSPSSSSSSSGSSSGTISGASPNTGTSASSILSAAKTFIQRGQNQNVITVDEVLNVLLPVGQTIQAIAVMVLIIVGLIMGVKYMISGADEKAKMKQKLIWYVVSAVVVFGVVGIYNLIASIVNSTGL